MNDLTIADIEIRQDEHGRYCLNDLYRASGGNPKNKPSEWMRNKQTKALIGELENQARIRARTKREFPLGRDAKIQENQAGIPAWSEPVKTDKPETGAPATFVVKELVYAYAMWVSPAFNLKVIRAYDALVTGDIKDRDQRLLRVERAYFERYPQRRTIRTLALAGEPYWYIAQCVRCAPGTVGNAIRHMIAWGMMEAQRLLAARTGMGSWWAFRRKHRHQMQLAL